MTRYQISSVSGLALALACGMSLAAPASDPAGLIGGRWQGEGVTAQVGKGPDAKKYVEKVTLEFGKDGSFKMVGEGIPEVKHKAATKAGKYSFVSEKEIELVLKSGDKEE